MIHSMSGGVITEYENLIYVYCLSEGTEQKRWYISPFIKVKVGDRVQVPASGITPATAKVLRVERVTAQTAPYPVSRTPEILSIL